MYWIMLTAIKGRLGRDPETDARYIRQIIYDPHLRIPYEINLAVLSAHCRLGDSYREDGTRFFALCRPLAVASLSQREIR